MSVSLQGMVEELLMKRNGRKFRREDAINYIDNGTRRGSWSYMKRDGSSQQITLPRSVSTEAGFTNANETNNSFASKKVIFRVLTMIILNVLNECLNVSISFFALVRLFAHLNLTMVLLPNHNAR